MAPKNKTYYICRNCGVSFKKWSGQCPDCRQWNTLEEQEKAPGKIQGYSGAAARVEPLAKVSLDLVSRVHTGMAEFDRVLGGGLVRGSVILVGGDPGVGKSTCLLQLSANLSREMTVLYATGEESPQQIAMRGRRLELVHDNLYVAAETRVEEICRMAADYQAGVLIVDSIQTMQTEEVDYAPGSVSQVRESAARLTRLAKETGLAVFLIGHVTKSGSIAGPRVLEHIIDVVCYMEGEKDSRFRLVRAVKNRYGAVNELGVFAMTERGMREISNPSAIFLSGLDEVLAGTVIMAVWEGSRPLLVEIQALVDESQAEMPRRLTLGLEHNRLAMLLAVLHRHGGVSTYNKDIFVNVVGGVKVTEPGADLAVIMAIVSSLKDEPLPDDLVVFGETGLSGEIRPVPGGQERLREAAKHGFRRAVVPGANKPKEQIPGLAVIAVQKLSEALDVLPSF
ncbi:MAG: DNA repair protein RadA [Desulfobia sp.]